MRRVVITGMGIWSCLGTNKEAVEAALREGRANTYRIWLSFPFDRHR